MPVVLLDAKTINRIAAGEVIERPASVVKELVENAIDAESTEIEVRIENGGRNLVAVIDNGNGVEKSDIELAFMRHATSKLKDNDLIEIKHLGFRGEALPSIAAVSRIKLSSRAHGANEAWSISYEGGEKTEEITPCSMTCGTHIEVCDLFFATPNRLKFLKTERAETQHIVDIINNLAMVNYDIGFSIISGNKKLLEYAKQVSLLDRLCEIEKEFQNNSLKVCEEEGGIKLTGYICKPTVNRGKSTMIHTFVNKRPIKDNLLIGAIRYAYHDLIPNNRYPCAALHLEIPYDQVDVNVHPNKSEVRFQNKSLIYEIVRRGLIKALSTRIGKEQSEELKNPFGEFIKGAGPEIDNTVDESINNIKDKKEFYEKRPSSLENELIRKFASPTNRNANKQEQGKLEDEQQRERIESYSLENELEKKCVLPVNTDHKEEEKQIEWIESYPLGYARCQVYNTYIIAESKNKLIIVDQHAAHERLVYECLKERSKIKTQKLLIPEVIEIKNQAGIEMMENYQDRISELGFDIEITESTVIVKEIPLILAGANVDEIIIDVMERLTEIEDTLPIEDKINKILATISCHGSIRAGREMKLEEMNELLRKMESTPYSGQCNHGRPTYIEVQLSDIEKWFERK